MLGIGHLHEWSDANQKRKVFRFTKNYEVFKRQAGKLTGIQPPDDVEHYFPYPYVGVVAVGDSSFINQHIYNVLSNHQIFLLTVELAVEVTEQNIAHLVTL